ncbi:MAG: cbb3-type cytochrome c oxidase subunit II [Planctomycetes bacterium]|nr:cbb3-type cytochrome c oxidase subunit II [Planctomycetota bacterium]
MDRFGSVILVAGLACFAFAFLLSGLYPYMITDHAVPAATIEDLASYVPADFKALKDAYPVSFAQRFSQAEAALTPRELVSLDASDPRRGQSEAAWQAAYAEALIQGRNLYISEVCWHCHSQYVRPVANESLRFGPVLTSDHDNNVLQQPVLWGTRRVGPDLTHEGRLRSNDWHVAHFFNPAEVTPGSIMPRYTWFYREGWQVMRRIDPGKADRTGLDPERAYGYPGVWETKAEAEAAMAQIKASLPSTLAGEAERMFVAEAEGPSSDLLSLIAYVQWLGTWTPPHLEQAQ